MRYPYYRRLLLGLTALLLSACSSKTAPPSQAPGASPSGAAPGAQTLLNVSYGATQELYQDYNTAFAQYWKGKGGQDVAVKQSFGGSGAQARAVVNGLEADVVTLSFPADVDAIQRAGLINPGWETKLPNDAAPYYSTIVFVVRQGNPKGIKDWPDLTHPGVGIVAANPKTGGGARWNYLAAYGYALETNGHNDAAARDFVSKVYHNMVKLDSDARAVTLDFTQHNLGDVYIAWENEAQLVVGKSHGRYQIIWPSRSITAEPTVAVVDKNVDKHGTRAVATAYLQYLYSDAGQTIAAQHFFRPRSASVAQKFAAQFPPVTLFDISLFGGWQAAQKTHFADGGVFDQIYGRR